MYTTIAMVATIVAPKSNSFPTTMPRSVPSKMSAKTLRNDPNNRVENQAKPTAAYSVTAPCVRITSPTMLLIRSMAEGESLGRNASNNPVTVRAAASGSLPRSSAIPEINSSTNGTSASRMLNASPPARNKTLSSSPCFHTRRPTSHQTLAVSRSAISGILPCL